ncbi:apelin receptor B-like [Oreochromis aureus]|uniref:G-protein coupled receptors family 1 profile domain-containing protein n=2 Tax=Oreochromis aureus TaxID=47969 RepID=A0AAZ1XKW6_OREAU|nr:apelin receptor B-like [Oreochromis aureus]
MKLLHGVLASVGVSGEKGVYAKEEGGGQWEGASRVGVYKWKQNSHTATDLSPVSCCEPSGGFFSPRSQFLKKKIRIRKEERVNMETTVGYEYYEDYEESDNSSMCDYSEWTPSYSVIPVLYMLIFILGLSGNGVVIFTVWRAQGKRRAADVYIGNLALADLTFVVTLPLWAVYTAMGYHWPFGVALCKISSYVVLLNMYASVFCLTCMSFDRYLAIVHSLSSNQLRSRGQMQGSLIAIWLLSVILAAPTLVFRTTKYDAETNRTSCAMDFSLVVTQKHQENLWIAGLSISSSALGFLLPFMAMMVCYGFIGCTVNRHFNTLRKEDQRKRRLLKIITTLVVVFAACWMPFHILKSADALTYLDLFPDTCDFLRFLLLAHPYATCLAYVNSCLNPFLYAFFDLRFRSQCLCLLNLKKFLHASPASSLSSQKTEIQSLATKV